MNENLKLEKRRNILLHHKKMHQWVAMLAVCVVGFVVGQLGGGRWAAAASCNIVLSMDEKSVDVGDAVVVTVGIEAEEAISGVEMMLTYDSDALEYLTGSPQVSGADGSLKISDLDMASDDTTVKYVIKFEVKKAGTSYVKVNTNPSIYNEASGQSMSVASNVLAVVGMAPKDTSGNTALKSLKISGGSMKPEFSKVVSEYTVTVDPGVKKLIISAEAEDASATVKVNGADSLEVGENKITVIVTAENGDTKEYTILAIREEKSQDSSEEETPDSSIEEENEENVSPEIEQVKKPLIVTKEGNQVILTTYASFVVEELTNEKILPSGYEKTTLLVDGYSVTVYQNLEEISDFVLLYASREGTEPTLYQYDKKEQTLQRLNHLLMVEEAKETLSENTNSSTVGNHSKIYDYLLIGLAVLCILFMGTTAIFYKKSKR